MKPCRTCKKEMPLDMFYSHPRMKDGRLNICKQCRIKAVKNHRERNLEKIRKYDCERAKRNSRKLAAAEQTKKARARNALYEKAHGAVARALKIGVIQKKSCEVCGRQDSHAHHDFYEQPLNIIWPCPPCHSLRHKFLKALVIGSAKEERLP